METPQGSSPESSGPTGWQSPSTPEPAPAAPPPVAAAPPPPPPAAPPPTSWETPADLTAGPAPGWVFGGAGERLVAYIVDIVITGIVVVLIAIVGAAITVGGASSDSGFLTGTGIVILVFAAVIVPLAYFPWFWARSGATPGMRMFGLQVVRDRDGGPISGGQAVLRLIGYWIDGVVFYLGYIWILIDKRKRGWHDLIAGTVVVKRAD
jgi:uncharacterized RDD family membrane protein YckC